MVRNIFPVKKEPGNFLSFVFFIILLDLNHVYLTLDRRPVPHTGYLFYFYTHLSL